MNRRSFFKYGLTAAASLLISPILSRKGSLTFADEKKPLSESDPLAQSMGYKNDGAKVDTKKFPKKAGDAGKKQKCSNCQFYTAVDAKHGGCQIFVNNTVMANGWCNSWTQKA